MSQTPRLAPLTAAEYNPDQQRLINRLGVSHLHATMARNVELYEKYQQFGYRLLWQSTLDPVTRETIILRATFQLGAVYAWVQHVELARREGVSEDVIAGAERADYEPSSGQVRLLFSLIDQVIAKHDVDDGTWGQLTAAYDEKQLLEIVLLVGNYLMMSAVLGTLRVQLEEGQSPPMWARG